MESTCAAAMASDVSLSGAAYLERVADVQCSLQIVQGASRIARVGAQQVGLAKIRAGQNRAVQLRANQVGFDEIRLR